MALLLSKCGGARHQPTTITSRNITRGYMYPAGGSILRDLLQNADEAGASFLVNPLWLLEFERNGWASAYRFQELIFDPRYHPTTPLIHPSLSEFQGPSLLAYSDSVSTTSNFESLSRIGDPHKLIEHNFASKYDYGFNSVYNWTDSPSILSGTSLLILGPHLSWSADLGSIYTGGLTYDFVEQFGEQAMKNQLAAFGSLQQNFRTEFVGTIIRLPLRTKEQAVKSAIVDDDKYTSQEDILFAFSKFKDEMVESLLFLKSVTSITLRIAGQNEVYAKVEILNKESVVPCKSSIIAAFQEIFNKRSNEEFETSFSMSIRYSSLGQNERVLSWEIFHHARRQFDNKTNLASWGEAQKLVPWVAIAALVRVEGCDQEQGIAGRLFTILPLPILTHQPVHIHGMFSLAEDCESIHQVRDQTAQGNSDLCLGSYWNSMMFEESLAPAWSKFLQELASHSASAVLKDGFRYWPRKVDQNQFSDSWPIFMKWFLEAVVNNDMSVWPTCRGFLTAKQVFLARTGSGGIEVNVKEPDVETLDILHALESVGMPITHPPDELYTDAKKYFEETGAKILTPLTAALFLRTVPEKLEFASENVKQRLLEYLLSGPGYAHMDGIRLFPMCDGSFAASRALSPATLMLPIDESERDLFILQPHITIDVRKLGPKLYAKLLDSMGRVENETSLKRWALEDLYDYCMATYFSGLSLSTAPDILEATDVCGPECKLSGSLRGLWDWIISRMPKESDHGFFLDLLGDMWLIPILGGRYRRVKPVNAQLLIDPSSRVELGRFLKSVCNNKVGAYETNPLYSSDSINASATEFLRKHNVMRDCGDLGALVNWLGYRPDFVSLFCFQERNELVQHLEILASDFLRSETAPIRRPRLLKQLRGLPVFQEISNSSEGTCLNWTALDKPNIKKCVAVTMKSVVPRIDGIVFLNARNPSAVALMKVLGLAEVPAMPRLLGEYVLRGLAVETIPDIVERLAVFALDNFASLSSGSIAGMARIKFVPVQSRDECGIVAKTLKPPGECVDPGGELGNFFFAHEMVWIRGDFWKAYSGKLARMGLMNTITVRLVLDRVRAYSDEMKQVRADEVYGKVEALISATARLDVPVLNAPGGRPWLPARLAGQENFLMARAEDCRDESFKDLVGYSMPIVPFTVGKNWRKALGWDKPIPPAALKKHLIVVVARKEFLSLEVVLDYLAMNSQSQGYLHCLRDFKWVPGVSGDIFKPGDLFFEHAARLSPWRDCIANRLGDKYKSLFVLLGVQQKPSLLELKQYVNSLDRETPLNQMDLDLAINAILLATELYPEEPFADFGVPDYTGTLYDLSALTAGAPQYCEAEIHFLHPRISQQAIDALGVPSLDQRQLENFADMDFDSDAEDAQAETRIAVINNTLKRYAIESTFSEFLASAEDLGTVTKVGWILDSIGDWGKSSLLTKELEETMGPGLLCWNDSIFTDENLRGLIGISRESKEHETERIERFGSGTLTMYHWTSLPQVVSGEFLVMFDPEGKYLPLNRDTRRRHTLMKIGLQKMQKHYPDHLKPYYGVLNFGPTSHRLEGTIFRFPFRTSTSKSSLVPDNRIIDAGDALKLIREYFSDAKISLLFLTRVTAVEFRLRGSETAEWEVTTTRSPVEGKIRGGFIEKLFVESRQLSPSQVQSITNDEWRLAHCDVSEALVPKALGDTQNEHGLKTRCGIAALISHQYGCPEFNGRFFGALPFRWPSKLPVHVHASFIVAGGRNLIPLTERTREKGSEWNLWILECGVVELYLNFLQHLARYFGKFALRFWPSHEDDSNPLSDKLGKQFWGRVPRSDLKLFTIEKRALRAPVLGIGFLETGGYRAQKSLLMKEVIFDFLELKESDLLCALLDQLGKKNIVRPTGVMSKALQQPGLEQIPKIDPPYVSCLLKSNQQKNVLHTIWAADGYSFSRLGPLLEFILKESRCLSDTITGCQILPLANQTLGILGRPGGHDTCKYYISQKGIMDLFDYAPGLIVHPDVSLTIVDILLKLDLNVSILPFSDIPRLFTDVTEVEKASLKFHYFLHKFWVSIRYEYEGRPEYDSSVLSKLPVHSALVNGQLRAISPDEFQSLPAIVCPDDAGEAAMCSKLLGLYLIDRRTVSHAMEKVESLCKSVGLMRFMEALGKLAKSRHKTLETYLTLYLEPGNITLLRQLVKDVVSKQVMVNHPAAISVLGSLPIWPTMCGKLVSAADALVVPDPRFCAPWIEGQQHFIEPKALQEFAPILTLLEIPKLDAPMFLTDYCRNTLDRQLKPADTNHYRVFIEAYVYHIGKLPPNSPLALDGNCCFRRLRELYDHTESVFIAAFRGSEKDHFLHPDFRYLKDWCMPGLRSVTPGVYYYECATTISKRASSRESWLSLEVDATTVFAYLRCQENFILQHWSNEEFRRLRGVQFVPIFRRRPPQPRHRRSQMNIISSSRVFGSLDDCVTANYLEICWSQCPIYSLPPSAYILQQIPSKGVPSILIVFRHIEYLAVHRNEVRSPEDIQLYMKDLIASYKFLNGYYSQPEHGLEKIRDIDHRILDMMIWLNVDEPITNVNSDMFDTSWTSAKDLCLGIEYDFSRYRFVRSILACYEKLLKALEVEEVRKPRLETTGPDVQFKATCERFYSFWQEGKLCDVELDVCGTVFKAHRVMLASASPHWENMFTEGWREVGEGRVAIKEATPHTVSVMLHFLYTGMLPSMDSDLEASENLDRIMGWLVAADQWDMLAFKAHVEEMIVRQNYIRLENVRQVLGIAREAQAKALSRCCEIYIEENRKVMERLNYSVMYDTVQLLPVCRER